MRNLVFFPQTMSVDPIIIITCKDWEGGKRIVDNYQKHKLLEKEIRLSLFSENDPKNN